MTKLQTDRPYICESFPRILVPSKHLLLQNGLEVETNPHFVELRNHPGEAPAAAGYHRLPPAAALCQLPENGSYTAGLFLTVF